MPDQLEYMQLVDLGLSSGLLTGIVIPFAGWSLKMIFNTIKIYFR